MGSEVHAGLSGRSKHPLLQGEGRGEDGLLVDSTRPIPTFNPPLEGEERSQAERGDMARIRSTISGNTLST
jgi:hypothetical protein